MKIPTLEELADTIQDPERKATYLESLKTMTPADRASAELAIQNLYMRARKVAFAMPRTSQADLADYKPSGRAAQRRARQLAAKRIHQVPEKRIQVTEHLPEEFGEF